MKERMETDIRAKAVEQYNILSAICFGLGFMLLFFASYTAIEIHGEGNGAFPYYIASMISSVGDREGFSLGYMLSTLVCGIVTSCCVGYLERKHRDGYIKGFIIIVVSIVGVAIHDRGQHECAAELVPQVKPLLKVHFLLSVLAAAVCVAGCILTAVFGLCPSSTCSYSTNYNFNYGMAAFLMCLQLLSLATSIFSILMFRHYRKHFVVHLKSQEKFASHVDFQNDM